MVSSSGPQHRKDTDLVEPVQERTKMISGLEHLSFAKSLSVSFAQLVVLLSLEQRRLQGDPIVAFQYLQRTYRNVGEGIFMRACNERIRGLSSN